MNFATLLAKFPAIADCLQAPLLLALRLYWGWGFVQTGWGKLTHLDRTASFFATLNIPAPYVNAIAAGGTECVAGALLLVGLKARFAAVPLIATMAVAYLTADREAVMALTSDPEKFVTAAPFLFLLASLVVLAFGPGALSLDRLIGGKRSGAC